jgi:prephenate dehydrogenase
MDLGSTKAEICHALDALPARFHNVGGHPMCGKESSGLIEADARLFRGAVFALCSLPSTTMTYRKIAEAIVTACGARPLWIGAEEHDQLVAATSHAPYLVANALAASMPVDATPLVGPGLRSTTRIAASSPEMMTDIILTNQEAILTQLSHFQAQLSSLQQLIGSGTAQEIREGLAEGQTRYHQIIIPRELI